jgi:hypothetical protein
MGMYENVLLFSDAHIPYGNSLSNTKPGQSLFPADASASTDYHYNTARAVFLGAQAGVVGFGRAMDWPMRVKWVEELLDGANQLRVTGGMIFGVKKTIFNSIDFGVIIISSWAVN